MAKRIGVRVAARLYVHFSRAREFYKNELPDDELVRKISLLTMLLIMEDKEFPPGYSDLSDEEIAGHIKYRQKCEDEHNFGRDWSWVLTPQPAEVTNIPDLFALNETLALIEGHIQGNSAALRAMQEKLDVLNKSISTFITTPPKVEPDPQPIPTEKIHGAISLPPRELTVPAATILTFPEGIIGPNGNIEKKESVAESKPPEKSEKPKPPDYLVMSQNELEAWDLVSGCRVGIAGGLRDVNLCNNLVKRLGVTADFPKCWLVEGSWRGNVDDWITATDLAIIFIPNGESPLTKATAIKCGKAVNENKLKFFITVNVLSPRTVAQALLGQSSKPKNTFSFKS